MLRVIIFTILFVNLSCEGVKAMECDCLTEGDDESDQLCQSEWCEFILIPWKFASLNTYNLWTSNCQYIR